MATAAIHRLRQREEGKEGALKLETTVEQKRPRLKAAVEDPPDAQLNRRRSWCAAGMLMMVSLYLICTWTSAFERFSPFWRFDFLKYW